MKKAANENKKTISTFKKLLILFIILLSVFGLINIIWYYSYKRVYDKLTYKMDTIHRSADDKETRYMKTLEGYDFMLKMPSYLGSGGFLTVGNSEGAISEVDEKGNVINSNGLYISLYIWPQAFGGYKMGLDFFDEANDIWEQVEVDSKLHLTSTENLDDQYVKYIQRMIKDNKKEINKLLNMAEDFWNIEL